uniref:Uncharacterized protein n=1 Tax=Solanum tuberosum TaxID=4113 RepID=M1A3W1_SOLTU
MLQYVPLSAAYTLVFHWYEEQLFREVKAYKLQSLARSADDYYFGLCYGFCF